MSEKRNIPELRFPEFSEKWSKSLLGDVVDITSASRVHKDEWTEHGVPFFRSSDVVASFNGTKNTKAFISLELYNSLSKKIGRVKKGDLLITGGGSIGIPFLIKNDDPLYFKDADLLWIKNTENTSGQFLYSFFITPQFKKYLGCITHIGTIAHYTVVQAKNTPFHFPSLPEQQKIAEFLSAVDKRIELLQAKKEKLEAYKKGVMQQIFSQKLRFKSDDGSDFPDWEEKKLGEMAKIFSGGTPKSSKPEFYGGSIPFIRSGEINSTETELFITNKALEKSSAKMVEKGDLLLAIYGATSGEVGISKIDGAINQAILCIRWHGKNAFLGDWLKLNKETLTKKYLQGGQGNLSGEIVKSYVIPVPTLEEQKKIVQFLTSLDSSIETLEKQINQTQTWKKGLLQKMFV